MEIEYLEFVTDEALHMLQRESRSIKRVGRQNIEELSMRAYIEMQRKNRVAFEDLVDRLRDCGLITSRLPLTAQEPEVMEAICVFATKKPLNAILVKFSTEPSKAFEDRLRQAAKIRNLPLSFFRLACDWVAVDLRPKQTPEEFDAKFMKDLNITL